VLLNIQERLQSASDFKMLALEAANLGAWEYRIETEEMFWDECCQCAFGFPAGDRIDYRAALNLIYSADRPAFDEAVRQAVAGSNGGTYHQDIRVVWPDSSIHWLSLHGQVYFNNEDAGQRAVRIIGVISDISARKRAEETLQRTALMLEDAGNNTPDLIVVKDIAGRIVYASPGTLRVLNRTPDQILGRTDSELHSNMEEAMILMANDRRVMCTRQRLVTQEQFTDYEGTHTFLSTKVPLLDSTGEVIGLVGYSRVITDHKQANVIPFSSKAATKGSTDLNEDSQGL
jgi:PAS domain S-box-containing protein